MYGCCKRAKFSGIRANSNIRNVLLTLSLLPFSADARVRNARGRERVWILAAATRLDLRAVLPIVFAIFNVRMSPPTLL